MRAGTSAPIFGPHLRGGDDARLRERILQRGQAEVIVRVAVADVDRGQLLAAGADQLDQPARVAGAELRIDQDRVMAAFDQHRGHREHRLRAGMEGLQVQLGLRRHGRRRGGRCGQQRGTGETGGQGEGEQQGSGTHGDVLVGISGRASARRYRWVAPGHARRTGRPAHAMINTPQ
ncbi:hypothetical protein G6F68_014465 [Rhizopus microsporus]|nr:hypothetical protein G6F68_014465 [Rhizopus microsporus]